MSDEDRINSYNLCRATKRLNNELNIIDESPIPGIDLRASKDNILEWHFVLYGKEDTPYYGGMYHGKLTFPSNYPFDPPSIIFLTPNGRFKTNERICFSISDFHPEQWNSSYSAVDLIYGVREFMHENTKTIGSIETSESEKRQLAQSSSIHNGGDKIFRQLFPQLYGKKVIDSEDISNESSLSKSTISLIRENTELPVKISQSSRTQSSASTEITLPPTGLAPVLSTPPTHTTRAMFSTVKYRGAQPFSGEVRSPLQNRVSPDFTISPTYSTPKNIETNTHIQVNPDLEDIPPDNSHKYSKLRFPPIKWSPGATHSQKKLPSLPKERIHRQIPQEKEISPQLETSPKHVGTPLPKIKVKPSLQNVSQRIFAKISPNYSKQKNFEKNSEKLESTELEDPAHYFGEYGKLPSPPIRSSGAAHSRRKLPYSPNEVIPQVITVRPVLIAQEENSFKMLRATKRLNRELNIIDKYPIPGIDLRANEDNILEWHFVIHGKEDTPYYGGMYHGKLIFPSNFPFGPPKIIFLTPNGRFKTNEFIRFTLSDFNLEEWKPNYSVSSVLQRIFSFMHENTETIGSIETSESVKRQLAENSSIHNGNDAIFCHFFPHLCGRKVTDSDDSSSESSTTSPVRESTPSPDEISLLLRIQSPAYTEVTLPLTHPVLSEITPPSPPGETAKHEGGTLLTSEVIAFFCEDSSSPHEIVQTFGEESSIPSEVIQEDFQTNFQIPENIAQLSPPIRYRGVTHLQRNLPFPPKEIIARQTPSPEMEISPNIEQVYTSIDVITQVDREILDRNKEDINSIRCSKFNLNAKEINFPICVLILLILGLLLLGLFIKPTSSNLY